MIFPVLGGSAMAGVLTVVLGFCNGAALDAPGMPNIPIKGCNCCAKDPEAA